MRFPCLSVWGAIIVAPLDYCRLIEVAAFNPIGQPARHKGRARAAWLVSLFIAVIDAEQ
jgi:hypothetical protein